MHTVRIVINILKLYGGVSLSGFGSKGLLGCVVPLRFISNVFEIRYVKILCKAFFFKILS